MKLPLFPLSLNFQTVGAEKLAKQLHQYKESFLYVVKNQKRNILTLFFSSKEERKEFSRKRIEIDGTLVQEGGKGRKTLFYLLIDAPMLSKEEVIAAFGTPSYIRLDQVLWEGLWTGKYSGVVLLSSPPPLYINVQGKTMHVKSETDEERNKRMGPRRRKAPPPSSSPSERPAQPSTSAPLPPRPPLPTPPTSLPSSLPLSVAAPAFEPAGGPLTPMKKPTQDSSSGIGKKRKQISPIASPPNKNNLGADEAPLVNGAFLDQLGLEFPNQDCLLTIYEGIKDSKEAAALSKIVPTPVGDCDKTWSKLPRTSGDLQDWYVLSTPKDPVEGSKIIDQVYQDLLAEDDLLWISENRYVQEVYRGAKRVLVVYKTRLANFRETMEEWEKESWGGDQ